MRSFCLLVIAGALGFGAQSWATESYDLNTYFEVVRCMRTASGGGCFPVTGANFQKTTIDLSYCSSDGRMCQGVWKSQPIAVAGLNFVGKVTIIKYPDHVMAILNASEEGDPDPVTTEFKLSEDGPAILVGAKVTSPSDPGIFYVPRVAIGPAN